MKRLIPLFFVIMVLVFAVGGCANPTPSPAEPPPTKAPTVPPAPTDTPQPTATPEPSAKILFVGNSLTFWNGGFDMHIEPLAASANPQLVIEADSVVESGASLRQLWERTEARESISEGDYDVVVLQEDIYKAYSVDTFHEYARRFVTETRGAGAEPVLFMQWSYFRRRINTEEIAQAHRDGTWRRRCTGWPRLAACDARTPRAGSGRET